MAHLEEDIIERAKNTDMIALLESEEGYSFKSTYGEREFKCIEHNSLVVNGNRRRWYWNSRQVGGNNAIDYLVKIRGMNFRDAVLHLVGNGKCICIKTCSDFSAVTGALSGRQTKLQ